MGGLFSSKSAEPARANVNTTTYRPDAYRYDNDFRNRILTQRNSSAYRNTMPSNNVMSYNRKTWNSATPYIISHQENPAVEPRFESGKYSPNYFPQRTILYVCNEPIYRLVPVLENEYEYRGIRKRITNKYFIIKSIERIESRLLESSYLLKKEHKLKYYPNLVELELFHGTKRLNADDICKNNFNWRYHGKGVGHMFGKGVSFSCNAMYASHYTDIDNDEKVMFLAKVIIGESCLGSNYMELPPEGFDTTTKQHDHIVVVKYEDNEFLPLYKIKFRISSGYVPMNKRNRVR